MPNVMREALSRVAGPKFSRALGQPDVAAFDGAGVVIPGSLIGKASAVALRVTATAAEFLSVRVSYAPGDAEGDPQGHCDVGLELGVFLECSVRFLADGSTAILKSKAISFSAATAEATVYILSPDEVERRSDVWFQRSVEVIRGETTIASAADVVRWKDSSPPTVTLSDDELTSIAADPALYLSEPPAASNGCGTWRLEGTGLVECY